MILTEINERYKINRSIILLYYSLVLNIKSFIILY